MADEEQAVDTPEEEAAPKRTPRAKPKKKSGGLGFVILLVMLVGGGVAALHFTGRLQPLIDKYLKKQDDITLTQPDTPEPEPETPVVASIEPEPEAPIVDSPPTEPEPEIVPESPLAAAYRKRYKAPQPGSKVALKMKSGSPLSGILQGIDDRQVHIKQLDINSEDASLSIDRSQLSVRSRAMFDEDMFVAYCVLYKEKQDEYARIRKQTAARLQAEYAKQGSRGTVASSTAPKPKPKPQKTVKVEEGEIAAYMRKHGTSDMLAERQKRIQQYERERAKEGREY